MRAIQLVRISAHRVIVTLMLGVLGPVVVVEFANAQRCVVADPTGTPLNIRIAPQGQVSGTVNNGVSVSIVDRSLDHNRKQWALISDQTGRRLGWVFRDFITCPETPPIVAQSFNESIYSIDGVRLGEQLQTTSAAYREYKCVPSEQFLGFMWCQKKSNMREARGPYISTWSILHSASGTVAYVNRSLDPAFSAQQEADEDIARLSKKYGSPARLLPLPSNSKNLRGTIAVWGSVELELLDSGRARELAAGRSIKAGLLIDHIADFQRSAQLGLPIYRLARGVGFVWAGSEDQRRLGSLRFLAIDTALLLDEGRGVAASQSSESFQTSVVSPRNGEAEEQRKALEEAERRRAHEEAVVKAAKVEAERGAAKELEERKKLEADPFLTDCDAYAASSADPRRKGAGISLDEIDSIRAIPACNDAIASYPNAMRFQYQLGRAFERDKNFEAASNSYRKAAENGYAAAQFSLGSMYARGLGVPNDEAAAISWYRRAADQGLVAAQTELDSKQRDRRGRK